MSFPHPPRARTRPAPVCASPSVAPVAVPLAPARADRTLLSGHTTARRPVPGIAAAYPQRRRSQAPLRPAVHRRRHSARASRSTRGQPALPLALVAQGWPADDHPRPIRRRFLRHSAIHSATILRPSFRRSPHPRLESPDTMAMRGPRRLHRLPTAFHAAPRSSPAVRSHCPSGTPVADLVSVFAEFLQERALSRLPSPRYSRPDHRRRNAAGHDPLQSLPRSVPREPIRPRWFADGTAPESAPAKLRDSTAVPPHPSGR